MYWQYAAYVLPVLLAAVVSAALAFYVWRYRTQPGALALLLQMLALAVWSLGYTLELASTYLVAKVLWAKLEYIGIVIVPLAWLVFVVQYTGRGRWLTRWSAGAALIVPLITLALVFTNEDHHLIWQSISQQSIGPLTVLVFSYGAGFWVYAVYAYTALALGTVLIVSAFIRSPDVYRKQILAWLAAMLAPWVGNALYLFGLNPLPHFDLTPFAFTFSGLSVAWAIFRFQFLEIMPIARDALIESMQEAVFVLDSQDRIVDLNPAAQRYFARPASEMLGREIDDLILLPLELIARGKAAEIRAEVSLGTSAARRDYELRISPVLSRKGGRLGRLAVLSDITGRKRAERRLQLQYNATRILSEVNSLAEAVPVILKDICETLEWEAGELWLVNGEAKALQLAALWQSAPVQATEFEAVTRKLTLAEGVDLPGQAWGSGRAAWAGNLLVKPNFSRREVAARLNWQGGLAYPIQFENTVVAVMAFFSREIRRPVELLDMFEAIASQIGQFVVRRQIETALRESEARYKSLFNQLPVGVYRTTIKGKFVHANPALASMLGYDSAEEVLLHCKAPDLYVDPEERGRMLAQWQANGIHNREAEFRRRDGSKIWVRNTGRAILSASGEIDYIDGVAEDITERRQAQESLAFRVRELSTLYETSLEISAQRDLTLLLQTIVRRAAELLRTHMGGLYLMLPDEQTLRLAVIHNLPDHYLGTELKLGEGLSGRVAQTGTPLMIPNYQQWEGRTKIFASQKIGRVLGMPLKVKDRVVGVINVTDPDRIGEFSQDDIRLVSLFADQAAVAIENSRLYDAVQNELSERKRTEAVLRESEQQYRSLYFVSQRQALEQGLLNKVRMALARELDLASLFRKVVEAIADTYGYTLVSIYLVQGEALLLQHQMGYDNVLHRIPLTQGVIGRVARTGVPVLLQNVEHDPDFLGAIGGIVSEVCVPLLDEGQIVGALNVENADGEPLSEADLNLMTALSEHVGVAIARARLYTEVRESERKFRAIIEAIPDLMVRISRDGNILSFGASPEGLQGLYLSSETIVGSTVDAILPPATANLIRGYIHKAIDTGELQVFEYEQPSSQGNQVYEVRLVVSGEAEVLAIARDVSERARLEQMKSDFINRAAHELRTPLTTASMMVDLIQEGGSDEEQQQYLGILDAELQRQRTLVEELLTVGRLESGTFQLNMRPLDLGPVVQASLSAVISLAHVKQIEVEDLSVPDLPAVMGNETGLQQVFINLFSNAIKFTPPEGKVSISMNPCEGGVRVRVSDTGMGIPREDLPHLFSRFFRASNAIQNEVPGTGVGLYVVKSIIEKLGGRVMVESQMGEGTTFEVWLPGAASVTADKADEVLEGVFSGSRR